MAPTTLARTIRDARERQELSLRDLSSATRCRKYPSGLGTSYLQRLERGRVQDPSPHVLRAIARPLGLTYTQLMRAAGYL